MPCKFTPVHRERTDDLQKLDKAGYVIFDVKWRTPGATEVWSWQRLVYHRTRTPRVTAAGSQPREPAKVQCC